MTDLKKIIDEELESMTFNELRKRRSIKMKRNFRIKKIMSVCAAAIAAVVIVGGTVYAVSGRFEDFFGALSRSEITDSTTESSLPAVSGNTADIAEYYAFPETYFETDGNVSAELLGVYGDSSTLMLSMVITPENGEDISNMSMPFYFTLKNPDGSEKLLGQSGIAGIEKFTPADIDGSYYLTFYLTDPNIAGGKLLVEADGIFTESQIQAAHKRLIEYDEQQRQNFERDDEWRTYKENGYENARCETERTILKAIAPEAAGAVSTEITVPAARASSIECGTYGISARLDSLSLYVSKVPDELQGDGYAGAAHTIYLKDGSVISDEFFMFEDVVLNSDEYNFSGSRYSQYPYMRGTENGFICCFDRPISADEIEKISVWVKSYDTDFNEQTTEYVIYGE